MALESRTHNAPKRPGNAYTLYIKDVMPQLKKENPKKSQPELFKKAAEEWNGLSDKNKQPYIKQYDKAREVYENLLKEFEKEGYYSEKTSRSRSSTKRKSEDTKTSQNRSESASTNKKAKKSVTHRE